MLFRSTIIGVPIDTQMYIYLNPLVREFKHKSLNSGTVKDIYTSLSKKFQVLKDQGIVSGKFEDFLNGEFELTNTKLIDNIQDDKNTLDNLKLQTAIAKLLASVSLKTDGFFDNQRIIKLTQTFPSDLKYMESSVESGKKIDEGVSNFNGNILNIPFIKKAYESFSKFVGLIRQLS